MRLARIYKQPCIFQYNKTGSTRQTAPLLIYGFRLLTAFNEYTGKIMKITKEDVIHVANLARLEMDEAAVEKFSHQIGSILDYVDTLNRLDTTGVSPTSHAIFLTNAFREDEVRTHLDPELALSNAPEKDGETFLVPRVIG
jgi:aspartyl-tRNA(Asn)/glutamyl-tRNA(Gln) amidotransferase subunit C